MEIRYRHFTEYNNIECEVRGFTFNEKMIENSIYSRRSDNLPSSFTVIILLLSIAASLCQGWDLGDAVINEIMWAGTSISPYDEYLEIRNLTGASVDFSVTHWSIYKNDDLMVTIDRGILLPFGIFLIARLDTNLSGIANIPQFITPLLVLNNSDVCYRLYAGPDSSYPLLDIADDCYGSPLAGVYGGPAMGVFWSMERNNPPGDGTLSCNWHNACLSLGFKAGVVARGTPGSPNYQNILPYWTTPSPVFPATDDSGACIIIDSLFDEDNLPDVLTLTQIWTRGNDTVLTCVETVMSHSSMRLCLPPDLAKPGNWYFVRLILTDSADTIYFCDSIFVHFDVHDIVISEINFHGSSRNDGDVWVEMISTRSDTIGLNRTPLYIWQRLYDEETRILRYINTGRWLPAEIKLLGRFPCHSPHTAIDICPEWVNPQLNIRSQRVFVAISDFPDTSFFIDKVDFSGIMPAGEYAPVESVWASMTRINFSEDGCSFSSWRTSTSSYGFIEGALDRGTPGFPDIPNSLPELFESDVPQFSPDTGTRDTIFQFTLTYRDVDNDTPVSSYLLLDKNCDGEWSPDERFDMVWSSGELPSDGITLTTAVSGLTPTKNGCAYSFRVNDGKVMRAWQVPAQCGPVVLNTLSIKILPISWHTESLFVRIHRYSLSSPLTIVNSGDMPVFFALKIAVEDTIPFDCCYSECRGGLRSVCSQESLTILCNTYILSALLLDKTLLPDTFWFDEEDCIKSSGFFTVHQNKFGYIPYTKQSLFPSDTANLWLRLALPTFFEGRMVEVDRLIIVQLKATGYLP